MNTWPSHAHVEVLGRLSPEQVAAVTAVVDAATETDGVQPLSEHVMLHLRHGGQEPARNLLVWHDTPSGPELAAYAHLDVTDPVEGPSAEMVVAPGLRRHGFGRALVERLHAETTSAGTGLRLWAHGDLPEASLMAQRLGFHRLRGLWQLRRSLADPLPPVELPADITIRTFNPGVDDEAWLALNRAAFAHHPEQGLWTLEDLRLRIGEDWFDPAGFFLAERAGSLIGFHWTKVHGRAPDHAHDHADPGQEHAGEHSGEHDHEHSGGHSGDHDHEHSGDHDHEHSGEHDHEPIGEVYVVGVHPSAQGHGLGRQLTLIGMHHLQAEGLHQVMLYVEASNHAAIRLYESLGFTRWDTDVVFRHD